MREIKFKLKKEKDTAGPYELGNRNINWYTEHGYEPLQYTGLKDKHGVEIYEGDIVKCMECENFFRDSKTEKITLVELYFDTPITRYSSGGPDGSVWFEDIEVIGNIYENPELLGGVNE